MNPNALSNEIAGAGRQVTLDNGETIVVRYGFKALKAIEDGYGSIDALLSVLREGVSGKMFGAIGLAIWAGTNRKVPLEDFYDLLSVTELANYATIFGEAIQEALGAPVGEPEATEPVAVTEEKILSPGLTSTTGQQ
jgi:hypothetical protein